MCVSTDDCTYGVHKRFYIIKDQREEGGGTREEMGPRDGAMGGRSDEVCFYTLPSCPAASARSLFQSTRAEPVPLATVVDEAEEEAVAAAAMETSSIMSSNPCLSIP